MRVLVRECSHDTVYGLRGERADSLLKLLNNKFESSGVNFSDCKITSVWLPDILSVSLEKRKFYEIKVGAEVSAVLTSISIVFFSSIEGITRSKQFEILNFIMRYLELILTLLTMHNIH